MKNNIRNKLIEAANKQQINDLSDEIIRKVDTTKVLNPTPSRKKHFNFSPLIFAGATACTLAVVIGVSIGLNLNNDKNGNPGNTANPSHSSSEETRMLLSKVSTQESYNIINIANSLNTVSIDNAEIGDGMNPEIENALVGDFNPYIYNIEAMYKLDAAVVSTVADNTNTEFNYAKDLKVVSPYYEYHLYYDEVITEQKNIDEPNYKETSELNGVIVCGFDVFEFSTTKNVKNGNITTINYDSVIYVTTTRYVEVKTEFKYEESTKKSNFTYYYNYHDGDVSKEVYVDQKIDADDNTTEVQFRSRKKIVDGKEKYAFELVVTANENKTLNCKIKSRDTKPFTAEKLENNKHKYTFISGNTYVL